MEALTLQACAKINLTMDVLSRRTDGYHEVDLLMQSVSLCDTLCIAPSDALTLTIEGGLKVEENNLVLRAARLLAEETGRIPLARLHLQKRIPVAAGLGGGSGDAAAALLGLDRLWGLNLPMARLLSIGAKLGADVPFCMLGGCRRATGIGTVLSHELENRVPLHLVIVKPCEGLLTREIFAGLHLDGHLRHPDTQGAVEAVRAGDCEGLIRCMGNVLESVAVPQRPQIAVAMQQLMDCGALHARMSGSGSAVFGLFAVREQAVEAALRMKRCYPECYFAESEAQGVKFLK